MLQPGGDERGRVPHVPQPSASGLERLGQPVPLGRGHMKASAGLGRAGVKEIGFVPGTLLPHTRYIGLLVWLCGRKKWCFTCLWLTKAVCLWVPSPWGRAVSARRVFRYHSTAGWMFAQLQQSGKSCSHPIVNCVSQHEEKSFLLYSLGLKRAPVEE